MTRFYRNTRWWVLGLGIVLAGGIVLQRVGSGVADEQPSKEDAHATKKNGNGSRGSTSNGHSERVTVVKPTKGGIPRSTTQPGTMESFDFADLYAKISGYVKVQSVDIGDMVKRGDLLVEIDAPEFAEELKEAEAAVNQAEAVVAQMKARVETAKAEHDAAVANIKLAESELSKSESYLEFREIQFKRIDELFKKDAIDERLVDEKHEQRDAAQAAKNSAEASIVAAKSQVVAAKARIVSAEADVQDAQAKVRLAQAQVGKARVYVDYTKIISPYDGVITRRSFHVGDFVRAADQGGSTPLLTVARTDLMRVIVQVPERDVPYTDVGDPAIVHVDVLSGEKFPGKVARIANSEDRVTKTMRTEIDLENPKNRLRDGMFGRVTIHVEEGSRGVTVPSSCIVRESKGNKTAAFVVRKGKAHKVPVETGQDDGSRIEVLSGLSVNDEVINDPSDDLTDGAGVDAELVHSKH